jgi:hypothetical protein
MLLKAPPCLDKKLVFAFSPLLMAVSKGETKLRGDCFLWMNFNISG